VSTLEQFNNIVRVSKEYAIYALKAVASASVYTNSNTSENNEEAKNENERKNKELKAEIIKAKNDLELVEIKTS
jgi:ribosomal protein L9